MKILIVEDDPEWRSLYAELFARGNHLLFGDTLVAAKAHFDTNPDIDVIVMDGCVESSEFDTVTLIRYIRAQGFEGPMIGASGAYDIHDRMVAAGCDVAGPKDQSELMLIRAVGQEG